MRASGGKAIDGDEFRRIWLQYLRAGGQSRASGLLIDTELMPRLIIATKNAHKTAEIAAKLGIDWEVDDLNAYPEMVSPEETGLTFEANATIKATIASKILGGWVMADDSGLEVDALGGAPGVRSARYAGLEANDAENRDCLLKALANFRGKERSARFRCALVLAKGGEPRGTFDGVVEGVIIHNERGGGGFGYDSIFLPDGFCETFGQLGSEIKNQVSHRARALEKAMNFLVGVRGDF